MFVPEKFDAGKTNIENAVSGYENSQKTDIYYFEAEGSNHAQGLLRYNEVSLQNSVRLSEITGDAFRSFRKTITDLNLFEQFRKVYIRKQTSHYFDGFYIYQLCKLLI
jgi:hypothetical protein